MDHGDKREMTQLKERPICLPRLTCPAFENKGAGQGLDALHRLQAVLLAKLWFWQLGQIQSPSRKVGASFKSAPWGIPHLLQWVLLEKLWFWQLGSGHIQSP